MTLVEHGDEPLENRRQDQRMVSCKDGSIVSEDVEVAVGPPMSGIYHLIGGLDPAGSFQSMAVQPTMKYLWLRYGVEAWRWKW